MHVRWSALRGMPVVEDETHGTVGFLADVHIDADRGHVLGFFVPMLVGVEAGPYFLSVEDILAVGTSVHIRSADRLSPPADLVRLQDSLQDPRVFLGQQIRMRPSDRALGRCADIQFDTKFFKIEWIFPRRFFVYRQPIPVSEIIEVTEEAIWVSESLAKKKVYVAFPQNERAVSLVPEAISS